MTTWYHQIKSMMQNIVDMSFMYHTKSIIKTMKMPSYQNNTKFIHQKVTCINIRNCSLTRDFKRMIISHIHMISLQKYQNHQLKAWKTSTHVYKLFFGDKVLNQHQNHCDALIKLVNNYEKLSQTGMKNICLNWWK